MKQKFIWLSKVYLQKTFTPKQDGPCGVDCFIQTPTMKKSDSVYLNIEHLSASYQQCIHKHHSQVNDIDYSYTKD